MSRCSADPAVAVILMSLPIPGSSSQTLVSFVWVEDPGHRCFCLSPSRLSSGGSIWVSTPTPT